MPSYDDPIPVSDYQQYSDELTDEQAVTVFENGGILTNAKYKNRILNGIIFPRDSSGETILDFPNRNFLYPLTYYRKDFSSSITKNKNLVAFYLNHLSDYYQSLVSNEGQPLTKMYKFTTYDMNDRKELFASHNSSHLEVNLIKEIFEIIDYLVEDIQNDDIDGVEQLIKSLSILEFEIAQFIMTSCKMFKSLVHQIVNDELNTKNDIQDMIEAQLYGTDNRVSGAQFHPNGFVFNNKQTNSLEQFFEAIELLGKDMVYSDVSNNVLNQLEEQIINSTSIDSQYASTRLLSPNQNVSYAVRSTSTFDLYVNDQLQSSSSLVSLDFDSSENLIATVIDSSNNIATIAAANEAGITFELKDGSDNLLDKITFDKQDDAHNKFMLDKEHVVVTDQTEISINITETRSTRPAYLIVKANGLTIDEYGFYYKLIHNSQEYDIVYAIDEKNITFTIPEDFPENVVMEFQIRLGRFSRTFSFEKVSADSAVQSLEIVSDTMTLIKQKYEITSENTFDFCKNKLRVDIYFYLKEIEEYDVADFFKSIKDSVSDLLEHGRQTDSFKLPSIYNKYHKAYMQDIPHPTVSSKSESFDIFIRHAQDDGMLLQLQLLAQSIPMRLPDHDNMYPLTDTNFKKAPYYNILKDNIDAMIGNLTSTARVNYYQSIFEFHTRYAYFEWAMQVLSVPWTGEEVLNYTPSYDFEKSLFYYQYNDEYIKQSFMNELDDAMTDDEKDSFKKALSQENMTELERIIIEPSNAKCLNTFRKIYWYLKTGKVSPVPESTSTSTPATNSSIITYEAKTDFLQRICSAEYLITKLCLLKSNSVNASDVKLFWFVTHELDDVEINMLFTNYGLSANRLAKLVSLANKDISQNQRSWLASLLQYDNKPFQDRIEVPTSDSSESSTAWYIYQISQLPKKIHKIIRQLSKYGFLDIAKVNKKSSEVKLMISDMLLNLQSMQRNNENSTLEVKELIKELSSDMQNVIDEIAKTKNSIPLIDKFPTIIQTHNFKNEMIQSQIDYSIPKTYTPAIKNFSFLLKYYKVHSVFDAIRRFTELPNHLTLHIGWSQIKLMGNQSYTSNPDLNMLFLFHLQNKDILYSYVNNPSLSRTYITKFKRRLEYLYQIIYDLRVELGLNVSETASELEKRDTIMDSILDGTMQNTFYALTPEKMSNCDNYTNVLRLSAIMLYDKESNFTEYSLVNRLKDILRKVTYRVLFDLREIEEKNVFGRFIKASNPLYIETLQWFATLKSYMKKNDILFSLMKLITPIAGIELDITSINTTGASYTSSGTLVEQSLTASKFQRTTYTQEFVENVLSGSSIIGNKYDKGLSNNKKSEKDLLRRVLYPYGVDASNNMLVGDHLFKNLTSKNIHLRDSSNNEILSYFDAMAFDPSISKINAKNRLDSTGWTGIITNKWKTPNTLDSQPQIHKDDLYNLYAKKRFSFSSMENVYEYSPTEKIPLAEAYFINDFDSSNNNIFVDLIENPPTTATAIKPDDLLHVTLKTKITRIVSTHDSLEDISNFLTSYQTSTYNDPFIQQLMANDPLKGQWYMSFKSDTITKEFQNYYDTNNKYPESNIVLLNYYLTKNQDVSDTEELDLLKERVVKFHNEDRLPFAKNEHMKESEIDADIILDDICFYILELVDEPEPTDPGEDGLPSVQTKRIKMILQLFIEIKDEIIEILDTWLHARNIDINHKVFSFYKETDYIDEKDRKEVLKDLNMPLKVFINNTDKLTSTDFLYNSKVFILNEIDKNNRFPKDSRFYSSDSLVEMMTKSVKEKFFEDLVNSIVLRYGRVNDIFLVFSDENERNDALVKYYKSDDVQEGSVTIESVVRKYYQNNDEKSGIINKIFEKHLGPGAEFRLETLLPTSVADANNSDKMTTLLNITDDMNKEKTQLILIELVEKLFPELREILENYISEWQKYTIRNLKHISTLLNIYLKSDNQITPPEENLHRFFSFSYKEDIIDLIERGTINESEYSNIRDPDELENILVNTVITSDITVHSDYKQFLYNVDLMDTTGNSYNFQSRSFLLENFDHVIGNLSFHNGQEYEYLKDLSIFIWIEQLPKDNREYIYKHPYLPYCVLDSAIAEKDETVNKLVSNQDLRSFMSLRFAYNLIKSAENDFSDEDFLTFENMDSEYRRSTIEEKEILDFRLDRYIDNTTQYFMNAVNNHNSSVMAAFRLNTYGPQVNYDDDGTIFDYGFGSSKNNVENAHEVSYGNHIGNKVGLADKNYMWTYKSVLIDDWWPPDDDRVHLYSYGYIFDHQKEFKQIPSNEDKAFYYNIHLNLSTSQSFHTNEYYSAQNVPWKLKNDEVTRYSKTYREVHNDFWGGDNNNNYLYNTDSPFYIYNSDVATYRQYSHWSIQNQNEDFADRWLGGRDNVDDIKSFEIGEHEIKYIYDIHHTVRIFDLHQYKQLTISDGPEHSYSLYKFNSSQNMKQIKQIVIDLESDAISAGSESEQLYRDFLDSISVNSLFSQSHVTIGFDSVRRNEYFFKRYEHEICSRLFEISQNIGGLSAKNNDLMDIIIEYAKKFGQHIDFSKSSNENGDPSVREPAIPLLKKQLLKHFKDVHTKSFKRSKIDEIVRTISLDKYKLKKDQLFLQTVRNITSPMLSSDLNDDGDYQVRHQGGIHTLSYDLRPFFNCYIDVQSFVKKATLDTTQILEKDHAELFSKISSEMYDLSEEEKLTYIETFFMTPFEIWKNNILKFDPTNYNANSSDSRLGLGTYPHKNRKVQTNVYYRAVYKSHAESLMSGFEFWRKFYQLQDFEYILKLGGSNFNFILQALDLKTTKPGDMRKLFFGMLGPVNKRLKEHVQRGSDGKGHDDERSFGLSPEQTRKMMKALFYIANHEKTKFGDDVLSFGIGSMNSLNSGLVELTEVQEERGRSIYEATVLSIIDNSYFENRLGFNEKQGQNDPSEIKIDLPHEQREFFIEVLKAYNWPYKYQDGASRDASGNIEKDGNDNIIYKYDELERHSNNLVQEVGLERDIGNYFEKLHDGNVALYKSLLESIENAEEVEFFLKVSGIGQVNASDLNLVSNNDQTLHYITYENTIWEVSPSFKENIYYVAEYNESGQLGKQGQIVPEAVNFAIVEPTIYNILASPENNVQSAVDLNDVSYDIFSPDTNINEYHLKHIDKDIITITKNADGAPVLTLNATDNDSSDDASFIVLSSDSPSLVRGGITVDLSILDNVKQYANRRGIFKHSIDPANPTKQRYFALSPSNPGPTGAVKKTNQFVVTGDGDFVNPFDTTINYNDIVESSGVPLTTDDRKDFLYNVSSIEPFTNDVKRIKNGTGHVFYTDNNGTFRATDPNNNIWKVDGDTISLNANTTIFVTLNAKMKHIISKITEYHFDDTVIKKNFFSRVNEKFKRKYGKDLSLHNQTDQQSFFGSLINANDIVTSNGNRKGDTKFTPYFSRKNNGNMQWYLSAYNYFYHTQNANIFHPNVYVTKGLVDMLISKQKVKNTKRSIPKYARITSYGENYDFTNKVQQSEVRYYNPYGDFSDPPNDLRGWSSVSFYSGTAFDQKTLYPTINGKMVDTQGNLISRSGCKLGTKDLSPHAWIPYTKELIHSSKKTNNFIDITEKYECVEDNTNNIIRVNDATQAGSDLTQNSIFYFETIPANMIGVDIVDMNGKKQSEELEEYTLYSLYGNISNNMYQNKYVQVRIDGANLVGTTTVNLVTYSDINYENSDSIVPYVFQKHNESWRPMKPILNGARIHYYPEELVDLLVTKSTGTEHSHLSTNIFVTFFEMLSIPMSKEKHYIFEGWDIPYWRYMFRRIYSVLRADASTLEQDADYVPADIIESIQSNSEMITMISYFMPYRSQDLVEPIITWKNWFEIMELFLFDKSTIGPKTFYGDFYLPIGDSRDSPDSISLEDDYYYSAITYPRFHEDEIRNNSVGKLFRKLIPCVLKNDPNKLELQASIDKIYDGFIKTKTQILAQYEYIYKNIMIGSLSSLNGITENVAQMFNVKLSNTYENIERQHNNRINSLINYINSITDENIQEILDLDNTFSFNQQALYAVDDRIQNILSTLQFTCPYNFINEKKPVQYFRTLMLYREILTIIDVNDDNYKKLLSYKDKLPLERNSENSKRVSKILMLMPAKDRKELVENIEDMLENISPESAYSRIIDDEDGSSLSNMNEFHLFKTIVQLHSLPDYYRHKYERFVPDIGKKNGVDYGITTLEPFFRSDLTFNYNFFWNRRKILPNDYTDNSYNASRQRSYDEYMDDYAYYPLQNLVDIHSNIKYDSTGIPYAAPKKQYNCVLAVHDFQRGAFFKDVFGNTGGKKLVEVGLRKSVMLEKSKAKLKEFKQFALHKAARVISEWEAWKYKWHSEKPELGIQPTDAWMKYVQEYKKLENKDEWYHHMLPGVPDASDLASQYDAVVEEYNCDKGRFTLSPTNKVFETLTSYFHSFIDNMEYMYDDMMQKHTMSGNIKFRFSNNQIIRNNKLVSASATTNLANSNANSHYISQNLDLYTMFHHPCFDDSSTVETNLVEDVLGFFSNIGLYKLGINSILGKQLNDNDNKNIITGTPTLGFRRQLEAINEFPTKSSINNRLYEDGTFKIRYRPLRSEHLSHCLPSFVKSLIKSFDPTSNGISMSFFNNLTPNPKLDFIPYGRIRYIEGFDVFSKMISLMDFNIRFLYLMDLKDMLPEPKDPSLEGVVQPAKAQKKVNKGFRYVKMAGEFLMGEGKLFKIFNRLFEWLGIIDDAVVAALREQVTKFCDIEGALSPNNFNPDEGFDAMLAKADAEDDSSQEEREKREKAMRDNRSSIITSMKNKENQFSILNPISIAFDVALLVLQQQSKEKPSPVKEILVAVFALVFIALGVMLIVELDFTNWNSNNRRRKVRNGPDGYRGARSLLATSPGKYTPTTLADENMNLIVTAMLGSPLSSVATHPFLQIFVKELNFKKNYMPSHIIGGMMIYRAFDSIGRLVSEKYTLLNSQFNQIDNISNLMYLNTKLPKDNTRPSEKFRTGLKAIVAVQSQVAFVRTMIKQRKLLFKVSGGKILQKMMKKKTHKRKMKTNQKYRDNYEIKRNDEIYEEYKGINVQVSQAQKELDKLKSLKGGKKAGRWRNLKINSKEKHVAKLKNKGIAAKKKLMLEKKGLDEDNIARSKHKSYSLGDKETESFEFGTHGTLQRQKGFRHAPIKTTSHSTGNIFDYQQKIKKLTKGPAKIFNTMNSKFQALKYKKNMANKSYLVALNKSHYQKNLRYDGYIQKYACYFHNGLGRKFLSYTAEKDVYFYLDYWGIWERASVGADYGEYSDYYLDWSKLND